MGKNIGKNINKNLSNNYSQKPLDHAKQIATDALETASKREIRKTADATGDLIGKKTLDRITKVSRTAPHNSPETVKKRYDKEIYISPEERQKIIDNLRLIQ